MGMCCRKKTLTGWRNVWNMSWRAPDQEVDQRWHGERLCKKIAKHVIWTGRMLWIVVDGRVTGQIADSPTRGLPTRKLDISQTGHLEDWLTSGLDNSRTSQLADWTSHGLDNSRSREWPKKTKTKHAKSQVASASCPVRDLSSMRVV